MSQPAVSQNIAELEKLVGAKLFERLKGETILTGEGEVFRQYAEKMLASCAGLDNMFAKISPTVVRISASEELYNYMVSLALESFRKIHPDVVFERAMFENADLVISLKPASSSVFDIPADPDFLLHPHLPPHPRIPCRLTVCLRCVIISYIPNLCDPDPHAQGFWNRCVDWEYIPTVTLRFRVARQYRQWTVTIFQITTKFLHIIADVSNLVEMI